MGYNVYRAVNGGAFARINDALVTESRFTDSSRPPGNVSYMIRAVALHIGPSGSYYDASEGVFAGLDAAAALVLPSDLDALNATKPADIVWMEDGLPAGAIGFASENDRWTWSRTNPSPFSGLFAHQAELAPGIHHHFFAFATTPLAVNAGDTLFAYVYLDPANPPREIIVTWLAGDWEHRAYWGENIIPEGADDSPARRNLGALPPAGRWVRLEVPASAVGMENQAATGMGFTLFDGRATWDRAGKSRP
jgi:hypothetical protein